MKQSRGRIIRTLKVVPVGICVRRQKKNQHIKYIKGILKDPNQISRKENFND
jgi:hypothetical protein